MPRYLLTTLFLFIVTNGYSQNLQDFKVPPNYQLVQKVEGDLDNDGINETVYAYNTATKQGEKGMKRILYITKKVNGKMKLWKMNSSVLWSSEDCGFYASEGVPLEMEIKRNTLSISQTFNHNSRHSSTYKSIFRYQHEDWFLIGSTHHDFDNCDFDFSYDVNFSIGKVIIDKTYSSCDEQTTPSQEDESFTFQYKFPEIPKMDGFVAGNKEINIPNTKQYFRY